MPQTLSMFQDYKSKFLNKLNIKFVKKYIFYYKYKLVMSKRYSGKSFKDSSTAKKPKLSLKEKRKNKKEKSKKS